MITIQFFAALKDYFNEKEEWPLHNKTIADLKETLSKAKPDAVPVLITCRFAVNLTFVNDNYLINDNETISIIPPAGGG